MRAICFVLLITGALLAGLTEPATGAQEGLGISEQFSTQVLRAPLTPAQIQPCPAGPVRDSIGLQEGLTIGKGN